MPQEPVYLDYNATTPCDPRVAEAMWPYFTQHFGNAASRTHSFGIRAREAVEWAREQTAALIAAEPGEIVFTSGATEAANLAIKGAYEMYSGKGNHLICCRTEHKAVLDSCHHLEKLGASVSWLDVNSQGLIDLDQLESLIRPETILIIVMFANNETGVIQPVAAVSALARKHGVLFCCDASQAVGKIAVDVNEMGLDLMPFSSHKIYGPKGVGALYVRRKNPRVKLVAQIDGGGHERNLRSGTLNVPGIVGFGKACELSRMERSAESSRIQTLRNHLEQQLTGLGARVNGHPAHRLPNTSNVSFPGVEGQALMMALRNEVALSSGSACTSATLEPSYVLKAMGISDELAYSSLRISLGRFTTDAEIDSVYAAFQQQLQNLQS